MRGEARRDLCPRKRGVSGAGRRGCGFPGVGGGCLCVLGAGAVLLCFFY